MVCKHFANGIIPSDKKKTSKQQMKKRAEYKKQKLRVVTQWFVKQDLLRTSVCCRAVTQCL